MIITKYVTRYGKPFPVSGLSPNSNIKVDVECPQCKVVRNVHYSGVIRSGHTICQKCSVTSCNEKNFNAGDRFGDLTFIERVRAGRSRFICDCGNAKEINNYNVRSGKTRSCGCARKSNHVYSDNTGAKHPNWKGGSSSNRERFMQSVIYKAWRLDVFERDAFTCDKCNQVGGSLEAHHLAPYHSHYALRVDLDNGIALCKECHGEFHNKYGRTKFTPADYLEFKTC